VKIVAHYWKGDPVPMTSAGYENLALGILEEIPEVDVVRPCDIERIFQLLVLVLVDLAEKFGQELATLGKLHVKTVCRKIIIYFFSLKQVILSFSVF
jgi:hypothetical protein